ncbi:universal stress protein UspA-like protein [Saccharomonospora marina XMU15]|uniref:Universal stress protein UspA-like protein n=1 Tax=Saccharomonospora marina XMU15 TaxID=882083 RepID=H5X2P2_9PSEU|nr:universal stress protein [Saccharomonospora marina]EHR50981.1 universal stress protein UspA-like protein [Saccharomonospora marina XMU15]
MSDAAGTPNRTIVVGVDGSPASEQALRWALAETERCGGQVHAITVRRRDDLLPGTTFALQPYGRRPARTEESLRESLHSQVATMSDTAAGRAATTVTESVVTGDPATELSKASASADLLVLGSHGQRAFTEVLLGSVAAECVRRAQCPVVLIPAGLAR